MDAREIAERQTREGAIHEEETDFLARAYLKLEAVRDAVIELRKWGVEFDDARIDYIQVQIGRADIAALDAALAAVEEEEGR